MEKISVAEARQATAVGREVQLQGWIRTRRDSKGGFSFLELNDGSCQGNVQVIADATLPNYEETIKHLAAGFSVTVTTLVCGSIVSLLFRSALRRGCPVRQAAP